MVVKNTELTLTGSFSLKQYFSWKVIKLIIKTGIIKSNLMGMFAGLCLALYMNDSGFVEQLPNIIISLIGTSFVVGGSGAINNYYDRDIDSKMQRTKVRPTVDGSINPRFALWLGIILVTVGLALLLSVSIFAAIMGFLGFTFYVFAYTIFTKRSTIYNTEVGSLSGAMPPIIGWAVISSDIFHPVAIALFVFMFLWQPPHFYAIAIRRLEEYKTAGVPMLPVVKGIHRTKVQSLLYLVILLFASILFLPFSKIIAFSMFGLTLAWMILGIWGFKKVDDIKWANLMFAFSLIHLTILFSLMIIVSLI
ncbi:protoheme IX farnesyltransferase [Metabacillus sp. KUDC1714]|uniref:Protoheme IX farnesyltransferase n=1 Tax=Metabacillus elymi TaxID=2745198 RepID=A0ABX6S4U8_9BACI|nr:protoheme IX farnesyltransferase [Metabacillus sp. KUDC1714]